MLHELGSFDDGLFYCLFDTPDRIQHLFWRFREPDHPANRGNPPDPGFASVVDDCYRRCDAIVGRALEHVDDQTLLIALSDHGFNSFRRGVHLNTWLFDNGFPALRESIRRAAANCSGRSTGPDPGLRAGSQRPHLNLKGREEVDHPPRKLAVTVAGPGLTGLTDHQRQGTLAIRRAARRSIPPPRPDLLVDFAEVYRISWSSSMGGVALGQFEDNVKKWSGDHIIDPDRVPGVLFMNRPFRGDGARLTDLAPTILAALGVPKGPAMEGESLTS